MIFLGLFGLIVSILVCFFLSNTPKTNFWCSYDEKQKIHDGILEKKSNLNNDFEILKVFNFEFLVVKFLQNSGFMNLAWLNY